MISPIERYALTSCDLYRTVPSLIIPSFSGSLVSLLPERLECETSKGMHKSSDDEFGSFASSKWQYLPLLESEALESLQESLTNNTSGFALATWFMPAPEAEAADIYQMQPIVTLGTQAPPNSPDDMYGPGCPGYDLQIMQFQRKIHISYADGDPGRSCRYLRVDSFNLLNWVGKKIHVVLTFDSMYTNLYVNGVGRILGARNLFEPTLKHWNMEENTIQLFGAYSSEYIFGGSIQQLDIFGNALDVAQVSELYSEGVQQVKQPTPIVVLAEPQLIGNHMRQDDTGTPMMLQVGSTNSSSFVLQLDVEVLSLPKHGKLISTAGSIGTISVGTRSPIGVGNSSVAFRFELSSDDYFNQPNFDAHGGDLMVEPESFHFRILAYDAKNPIQLLAVSPIMTQSVHVLHVNHPPVRLDGPDQAVLDLVKHNKAVVADLVFEDDPRDFSMDRVRVDVWAKHGEVSLASSLRSLADFDSCRSRSSWKCVNGPGRTLTFVALPDDVSLILRNLEYTNLSPSGDSDEIVVRVSDGAGGMCLTNAEHWEFQQSLMDQNAKNRTLLFDSVRDNCFQIQATIRVPGYDTTNQPSNRGGTSGKSHDFFDSVGVPDLIFLVVVVVLVACCACCLRKCPSCMARGVAVEVDNDDESFVMENSEAASEEHTDTPDSEINEQV